MLFPSEMDLVCPLLGRGGIVVSWVVSRFRNAFPRASSYSGESSRGYKVPGIAATRNDLFVLHSQGTLTIYLSVSLSFSLSIFGVSSLASLSGGQYQDISHLKQPFHSSPPA